MIRNWKFGIVAVLAILCLALFAACEGPIGPAGQNGLDGNHGNDGVDGRDGIEGLCTVTFDTDGGVFSGKPIAPEKVAPGGKVTRPGKTPGKQATGGAAGGYGLLRTVNDILSYTFLGWAGPDGELWDFDAEIVESDITLKAIWGAPEAISTVGGDDIVSAVNYVNANPGEYVLILNDGVNALAQAPGLTLSGGSHLTIQAADRPIDPDDPTTDPDDTSYIPRASVVVTTSANGSTFIVTGAGTVLTIGDYITLTGRTANNNSVVRVTGGAAFVMEDGSKITGNVNNNNTAATGYGATVYVTDAGSKFIMEGGEISGNSGRQGTVYLLANGSFEMNGGSIESNISSGTALQANNVATGYGAAVNMQAGSFTMTGGVIKNNTCTNYSGSYITSGVYIAHNTNSVFTMTGGEISTDTTIASGTIPAYIPAGIHFDRTGNNTNHGKLILSGNVKISKILLKANNATNLNKISVAGALSGTEKIIIDLHGNNGNVTTALGWWSTTVPVLEAAGSYAALVAGDLAKFEMGICHNNATAVFAANNNSDISARSLALNAASTAATLQP